MKAYNFLEFIRSYNFENYNEVNDLEQRLLTTDKGLMIYKNSKERTVTGIILHLMIMAVWIYLEVFRSVC